MALTVNAAPTKRFFIANLTRDLTLEDAILDLVDNSVDAYIRTHHTDVSPQMLHAPLPAPEIVQAMKAAPPLVKIELTETSFRITDRCGGMDLAHAKNNVFRHGRTDDGYYGALGVYGIGLKRAIFKIGKQITVESQTAESGFEVNINVPEWSAKENDWTFPLKITTPASSAGESGTTITITDLNPEVVLRLNDGTLFKKLSDSLGSTYSLFLQQFLTIELNGRRVTARPLPVAFSNELPTGHNAFSYNGVTAQLVAGLAPRQNNEWLGESAGWYVLCNGRVVVSADKTDLTGWGLPGPQYVSKYRGFVGVAFFFSSEPSHLPWTTTKRGLNIESPSYQLARKEMIALSRPVLTFLNNMYPSDAPEELAARKAVQSLKTVEISAVLARPAEPFRPAPTARATKKTTVSVRFLAKKADVERAKRHLGKSDWGAAQVGRHAFEYFIRMECPG